MCRVLTALAIADGSTRWQSPQFSPVLHKIIIFFSHLLTIFVIIHVSNQLFALCIFFVSVFPLREVISLCISISQVNCHLEQPYVETKKRKLGLVV